MKVLQILPRLNSGGVERGTVELASYLISQGHDALVVSFGGWREKQLQQIGAKHIKLPVHSKNPILMFSLIPVLAKIMDQYAVDIVHVRSRVPGWIAYYATKMVNRIRFKRERYPKIVNFITTCHGRYSKGPISWVMGMGRRVIVPSEFIGKHMENVFGVPQERIVLIPRGVDLDEFAYRDFPIRKDPIFLVVGRITPNKGQEVVINAFAKVNRKYPNTQLWIVGDVGNSNYYQRLRALQVSFSLQDSVKFLGPRQDISEIISRCFAVLVPSQYPESFGRVVLEAGAVGRPVLVSNLPALNELVDGKNGLVVQPDSVQDWESKMVYLLNHPEKARDMGIRGRKVAEKYTMEQMCEKTISVYESVLGSYRIGIIKTSALGDIALARYSFHTIKKNFVNSEVLPIGSETTKLVWGSSNYLTLWELIRSRYSDLDIIYDLQGKTMTQFLAWLSGAPRRFGYSRKMGWFFHSDPIRYERDYPIREQERFLVQCGLLPEKVETFQVEVPEKDKQEVLLRIQGNTFGSVRKKKIIGIVVRSNWPSKTLPEEEIVDLILKVDKRGRYLWVLIGTISDREVSEDIIRRVRENNPNISLSDLTGRTGPAELFSLISVLDLLITPDSAPVHFAYLVRTPTIVYFGPTSLDRHLPDYPDQLGFIHPIQSDICHPCYKKICPLGSHECMRGLSERIVEEIREVFSVG